MNTCSSSPKNTALRRRIAAAAKHGSGRRRQQQAATAVAALAAAWICPEPAAGVRLLVSVNRAANPAAQSAGRNQIAGGGRGGSPAAEWQCMPDTQCAGEPLTLLFVPPRLALGPCTATAHCWRKLQAHTTRTRPIAAAVSHTRLETRDGLWAWQGERRPRRVCGAFHPLYRLGQRAT